MKVNILSEDNTFKYQSRDFNIENSKGQRYSLNLERNIVSGNLESPQVILFLAKWQFLYKKIQILATKKLKPFSNFYNLTASKQ